MGELGTFCAGAGKGGGVPESATYFLYCCDTAGSPFQGGNVGPEAEYGVRPGHFPGQGFKAPNREATLPWEVWAVVLPITDGSNEGGGVHADQDVDPSEAEYGRAIYCDATDYGPM